MRRFFSLLIITLTLFVFTTAARAEDNPPPPPPGGSAHNNPSDPAPPVGESGTKTVAKNEEESDTASLLARLKAWGTGKTALADQITTLETRLKAEEKKVKEGNDKIATLEAENKQMRADLADFAAWLESSGFQGELKEAAGDPGKAFKQAVGGGVANEIRKIGVPAGKIKTPPTDSSGTTSGGPDSLREAFRAEKDPVKKAALRRQLVAAEDAAKKAAN